MKKKIFIPMSFTFILLNLLLFIFFCASTYAFALLFITHDTRIIYYIVLTLAIIFWFYSTIRFLFAFKIYLKDDSIGTNGDGLQKFEKIQYKCNIPYLQIKNISIVASDKNSKNKKIKLAWLSSAMPKKYLKFTLIDNEKERICINHYTKKQIIKLLKYLNLNMQKTGNLNILNINNIMENWYSYIGYNRKKIKSKHAEKIKSNDKKEDKS